jgi:CHASE3 domain sensor protein
MRTTTDLWGNPVSNASAQDIRGLEGAITLMNAYQADPLAAVDRLIAANPGFVMAHAFRAGMMATTGDKAFEGELAKSVAAASALA